MPVLDSQPTALTEQARPRPTPAVLHRLASQSRAMHLFGRRGPRLPPLSPGKPFWHSAVFVASAISSFRTRHLDRRLHALLPQHLRASIPSRKSLGLLVPVPSSGWCGLQRGVAELARRPIPWQCCEDLGSGFAAEYVQACRCTTEVMYVRGICEELSATAAALRADSVTKTTKPVFRFLKEKQICETGWIRPDSIRAGTRSS